MPDIAGRHVTLVNEHVAVVVDVGEAAPAVVCVGSPALAAGNGDDLAAALEWPFGRGGLDALAPLTLLPETSLGFAGRPGIEGHRDDGSGWAPRMTASCVAASDDSVVTTASDDDIGLEQRVALALHPSGMLTIDVTVTNTGDDAYRLGGVTPCIALPSDAREALVLGGRWSDEFRPERRPFTSGSVEVENRAGRTSHDRFPALFVGQVGFSDEAGAVLGAHLGWSGNSRMRVEAFGDGRRVLQVGEALLPGEICLMPGHSHVAPTVFLAWSPQGLNGISAVFHSYLRGRAHHPSRPRPVTLNTWEAVYFDHDLGRLLALADRAAEVGVERFVLDDGWFRHRRDDTAGLGDWYVDETVWPDGLGPLVDHVTGLGMEFGLWFEPEMVNEDSDLFRAHPDWVLAPVGQRPVTARNQLVLDLVDDDVFAYLFERIDDILASHAIGYVKWDMNRNLVAPSHLGRATVHHQTRAVYRLIDALRAAHPGVEFESCSSGGGRVDFGILERTDRIWTSDCNDPLDRQRIQRGFSYLFPPELMGAHIGPPRSHTTGRTHRLGFRAATAFFGHLGVEWNLLEASEDELTGLRRVIELHQSFRPLLHGGSTIRFDHPDPAVLAHGVVAPDRSEALVSFAVVSTPAAMATGPLRISGLAPDESYAIEVLDLVLPRRWGRAKQQPAWTDGGITLTGAQLASGGLQMPILDPESAVVVHARRADLDT